MNIIKTAEYFVLIVQPEDVEKTNWIYASKIKGSQYDEITEALEKVTG